MSLRSDLAGDNDLCQGALQKWTTPGVVDVVQRVVTSSECSPLMVPNTAYLSGTWKDDGGRRVQCFGVAAVGEFTLFLGKRGAYNDLKKCKA